MALALMAKHPIDIILADINMPIMNGLEFSKIVKQNYPACRIALITGYDYLDYAIQAVKIGVDDYILKPEMCIRDSYYLKDLSDNADDSSAPNFLSANKGISHIHSNN